MTINDAFDTQILLVEPVGPSLVGSALTHAGLHVDVLDRRAVDDAALEPERLAPRISADPDAALVIALARHAEGGAATVDWATQVHEPLQRCFTAIRGMVPELLAQPAGGRVVVVVPECGLFADARRTADSVLGRCLIGLTEGLRAELLGTAVSVSIVLTEPTDDEQSLASRIPGALRDGRLYAFPPSVSGADVSAVFDPWMQALARTSSDLALPPLGPMGEVYRAELGESAQDAGFEPASTSGVMPRTQLSRAAEVSVLVPGKTAVVTGGASGIGLGIARALLDRGMNVVIADVRDDHISDAVARVRHHGARVMSQRLDVTDRAAWKEAVTSITDRFGSVDIVCLNAGIGILGTILQSTPADWKWVMGVNLEGVTNGIEALLPIVRAQGNGGYVVATSSAGGLMVANDGGIYSSAKYGVVALMDCLRAELATEGIGVTTLCPAGVNTNIHDHETMRPDQFSDSGVRGSEADVALQQTMARKMLSHGADPADVGLMVLDAIEENAPIVFTDGGIAPIVQLRGAAMRASTTHHVPSEMGKK